MENNRPALDKLQSVFERWLHIEDPHYLHTLIATKVTHKLDGDPVWMLIVGPSSDGKTEYLRAITQEGEIVVDDVTEKTFISGMKKELRGGREQLAQRLHNSIWYMYDLSIMLSKRAEERSSILSDMRMVYDGRLVKEFGNGERCDIDTSNNTFLGGSTPEIDSTLLEDALLGTRFITYRIQTMNRFAVMSIIDRNEDNSDLMRNELKEAVKEFETTMKFDCYKMTTLENQNIQMLSNTTTLLRASASLDKQGEVRNIVYPESPGRLYKQLKKLYKAYRIIGLNEEEALICIRKICRDNINPVRIKLLTYMHNTKSKDKFTVVTKTTSNIHEHTGLGKKTVKSHMSIMNMMGIVSFKLREDHFRETEEWSLNDSSLNLILEKDETYPVGQTLKKYIKTG